MRAITETTLMLSRLGNLPRQEVQAAIPLETYTESGPPSAVPTAEAGDQTPTLPQGSAPVAEEPPFDPSPAVIDNSAAQSWVNDPQFLELTAAVRRAGIGPLSNWLYVNLDAIRLASLIRAFPPR